MEFMKIFDYFALLKEINNLALFFEQVFDQPLAEEKDLDSIALSPFSTSTQNMYSEINNNFQDVHSPLTFLQDYQNSLSTFSNPASSQVQKSFFQHQNTTQNQHTLLGTQNMFQAQSEFFEPKQTNNAFQSLFQKDFATQTFQGNAEKQQIFSSLLNLLEGKIFNSSIISPAFHKESNVFDNENTATSQNHILKQMSSLYINPTLYADPTEIFTNTLQSTVFSSNIENGEDLIHSSFPEKISALFRENQWESTKYQNQNLSTHYSTNNSVKQSASSPIPQKAFSVNIQSIYLPQVNSTQDFMQELQNIVAQYSGNI